MIVKKDFEIGTVVSLKLVSGEEVVGKIVAQDETIISLKQPYSMVMMTDPRNPGQGYVSFAPFMVGIEQNVNIDFAKSNIVAQAKAGDEATKKYQSATSPIAQANPYDLASLNASALGNMKG